jgi:hypothetical protein
MALTKLVVTNRTALTKKYGATGVLQIDAALAAMSQADAKRGITTTVVGLDDKSVLGTSAVKASSKPRTYKKALDRLIAKRGEPDYLMLLGSVDVIPHQALTNPVYDGKNDVDATVPSDLPYACKAPASKEIGDFRAPTRALARLPDLTGAKTPEYLTSVIRLAAAMKTRPASSYATVFGLSAKVWSGSTTKSLAALGAGAPKQSPPSSPSWTKSVLAPRLHFINCHGAQVDEHFYGQSGNSFPIAYQSSDLTGKITAGTAAAVECCYGAELYAPDPKRPMPTCNRYLADGAVAYFGSTTIAYGPATGNALADLIARYFLESLRGGASVGSAAMTAWQQFVKKAAPLDPTELKTLAQFVPLGDPSLRPVKPPGVEIPHGAKAFAGGAASKAMLSRHTAHRARLAKVATQLQTGVDRAATKASGAVPKPVRDKLEEMAERHGAKPPGRMKRFRVKHAKSARARKALQGGAECTAFTVAHVPTPAPSARKALRGGAGRISTHIVLVAREHDGRVEYRTLYARGGGT